MSDLAERLANRIQLTSDGLNAYLNAVERAFRGDVDYAQTSHDALQLRIPTKKIAHSELMTIKIVAERRCQKVLCSR